MKNLTGDEYALKVRELDKQITDLGVKRDKLKTHKDYLTLKWGTLKSWSFTSKNGKHLLEEYFKIGSCASAMLQEDTEKQKSIICDLIDECKGVIQNDWTGEYLTKQEAKAYVLNYRN